MRIQKAWSPLLWLLLPAIVNSLSVPQEATGDDTPLAGAKNALLHNDVQDIHATITTKGLPTQKPDVGTKDAPVDGLDGKPHAGPWVQVEGETGRKKQKAGVEDLGKPTPTSLSRLEKEYSSQNGWQLIPEKNDGVMDDTNRAAPKQGTTGTEGGVSEKSKNGKSSKKPDSPKEPPPLPHSEQQRIQEKAETAAKAKGDVTSTKQEKDKPKGAQGLEKPTDLPDTPLEDKSTSTHKTDSERTEPDPHSAGKTTTASTGLIPEQEAEGIIQPMHSFVLSLVMILFSEVGDKTFLVAALMAMRHDRIVVFTAAFSALIAMTVLSAVLGHAVPTLLPRRFVAFSAAILFLVFGAKMLREGLAMPHDSGVGEEMKEVEAELEEKEEAARKMNGRRRSEISSFNLEAGRGRRSGGALPAPARSPSTDSERSASPSGKKSVANALGGLNNLLSLILSPAWVQTFVMTFLGEWGDRSQIATIAMAAGQDYWWVTAGAVTGHMFCTAVAVIGGRALAGRVSMRVVTIGGAVAFLVFGVIYLFEAIYFEATPPLTH